MTESKVITSGSWGEIPWEFHVQVEMPQSELCTAAFCIVTFDSKLVLVEHEERGLEFAGGHIDHPETAAETVKREVLEQSGAVIKNPVFFGYKKISPAKPILYRDDPKKSYPFPHSYVPYFYAEASEVLDVQLTPDVKRVALVSFDDAVKLLAPTHNHNKVLEFLIEEKLIRSLS